MDAQQFLAEFGHIVNAPGGVAQLRELVLQLAVSGQLIRPDSSNDASPLLASIEAQKREHFEKKKIVAKQASILRSSLKVPPHWAVCRLGDLTLTITGGGTPSKNQPAYWGGDIPWASVKDLKDLTFLDNTEDHITKEGLKNSSSNLIPPGRIIVCTRMGLGKVAINRVAIAINQDLKALELPQEVNPHYFLILYRTRDVKGKGTTVSGIKQDQLLALPSALPPLEEQAQIVAKVDELMALCDKLEEQQQTRRKLQNAFRQTALQAVAIAKGPRELQTGWIRLEANFGRLFDVPEDIAEFKGLVLDLAVNGRLLPPIQRPPSTGKDVLQAIAEARENWERCAVGQEQKEALTMHKKLRTQQVPTPNDPLPEHWCWGSLLQVAQALVDCHNKTAPYVANGIHLVRTTDIRNGRMDLTKTKKISEETFTYWARRMPPRAGDIFFTREAPMGEAAIVPDDEKVCLGQRTMLIRLFTEHFSNQYLLYVIMSPSFQARMANAAIGMTVKHLRVGGVEDLVVPVPPKSEQDQIVSCVERLFWLCDRHMETLNKARHVARSLAASTISKLTGVSVEQEELEHVKAPQTELIATLRLGQVPSVKEQAPLATLLARHKGELSASDLWQRFGGEIDAFYAQLKTEVDCGWIQEPTVAEMREKYLPKARA
ncbi:restriction endonuclease subunit S [Burkholderia ubonensis]|uniref:restriction endonuclease subunit S n=1 Tax=Burkholderia ubonensis TaxID=101571 RepID=UPI0009B30037|nr:restriction endonuclease subunit S [Burkholderia ubonensis]